MEPPLPKLKPKSRRKAITKIMKQCNSENTARSYRAGIVKFLDYIYGIEETRRDGNSPQGGGNRSPDMEFYDSLAIQYLEEDRDHADDLMDFIAEHRDAAGKTKAAWKAGVMCWFEANRIYLHPQETRRIRVNARARTQDRIPTREELRAIMEHSDIQTRALIMLLSSSGMRAGEAVQLKWSDLDLDRGMIRVRAETTKGKVPRITFVSLEAMELLREWRAHQPAYIEGKRDYKTESDAKGDPDLIFPCTYRNVLKKFRRALIRAGLGERDGSTGRYTIHLHALRKYYRTRLPAGGASVDVVELLMGHEGYLNSSYLRLTVEDLERAYRQAEYEVWVYKTRPINDGELKQLERENQELRGEISDIRRQMAVRAPVESYLDELLRDPEGNAAKLRRLKEVLSEL
jgi:integrase